MITIGADIQSVALMSAAVHLREPGAGCFHEAELAHSRSSSSGELSSLAGMFAAKEALFKALRNRPDCYWDDLEVVHDNHGTPGMHFRGELASWTVAQKLQVSISISHSAEYALAMAIVERLP